MGTPQPARTRSLATPGETAIPTPLSLGGRGPGAPCACRTAGAPATKQGGRGCRRSTGGRRRDGLGSRRQHLDGGFSGCRPQVLPVTAVAGGGQVVGTQCDSGVAGGIAPAHGSRHLTHECHTCVSLAGGRSVWEGRSAGGTNERSAPGRRVPPALQRLPCPRGAGTHHLARV